MGVDFEIIREFVEDKMGYMPPSAKDTAAAKLTELLTNHQDLVVAKITAMNSMIEGILTGDQTLQQDAAMTLNEANKKLNIGTGTGWSDVQSLAVQWELQNNP